MKTQDERIRELSRKVADLKDEKNELAATTNTYYAELEQVRGGLETATGELKTATLGRVVDAAVLKNPDILEKARPEVIDHLMRVFELEDGRAIMRDQSGHVVMGNSLLAPRTPQEHLAGLLKDQKDYWLASSHEPQTQESPQDDLRDATTSELFAAGLTSS